MAKITPKRERFCLELVKPKMDQVSAYRAAFDCRKMKDATIHNEAYKLLLRPEISARVKELKALAAQAVVITRAEWLHKLKLVCFDSDVRKMFVGPGQPKEIHELDEAEAMLIEGFEVIENFQKVGDKAEHVGYTRKVKLASKVKALLELGDAMGFYEPDKDKKPRRIVLREYKEVHYHASGTSGPIVDVSPVSHGLDNGGSGGNGAAHAEAIPGS